MFAPALPSWCKCHQSRLSHLPPLNNWIAFRHWSSSKKITQAEKRLHIRNSSSQDSRRQPGCSFIIKCFPAPHILKKKSEKNRMLVGAARGEQIVKWKEDLVAYSHAYSSTYRKELPPLQHQWGRCLWNSVSKVYLLNNLLLTSSGLNLAVFPLSLTPIRCIWVLLLSPLCKNLHPLVSRKSRI